METLSVSDILFFTVWVGTLLGGFLGLCLKKLFKKGIEGLLIVCGGLLVGVICFELVPHSMNHHGITGLCIGSLVGFLFMWLLDTVLRSLQPRVEEVDSTIQPFIFLFFAISLHNIPAGMALGSSGVDTTYVSSPLLVAMFIHHIPEGFTLLITLIRTKYFVPIFVIISLLLASVLAIGYNIGKLVSDTELMKAILMGMAIMTLSYVSFYEILWKARRNVHTLSFIGLTIVGILLMGVLLQFIH